MQRSAREDSAAFLAASHKLSSTGSEGEVINLDSLGLFHIRARPSALPAHSMHAPPGRGGALNAWRQAQSLCSVSTCSYTMQKHHS